jgi:hypothetical protein
MQHIRIAARPTYIFNYLFIYDIVVPKFKPQYHLSCQPWAIISLGLVRGFSKLAVYSVQSHRFYIYMARSGSLFVVFEPLSYTFYAVSNISGQCNNCTAECRSTISLYFLLIVFQILNRLVYQLTASNRPIEDISCFRFIKSNL